MSNEATHYHTARAMRELDMGLNARCTASARAHLQLSSLHMARIRELQGGPETIRPPLIMA